MKNSRDKESLKATDNERSGMNQKIKEISISELVLWSENPRDPIDGRASDQSIVDRALQDRGKKWNITKLAKEMGDYYDYSELPTVVYHGSKPVVYDGNRRIVLAKIKLGLVNIESTVGLNPSKLPNFPSKIPCNVCEKDTALKNIYRKHAESGSWGPLERDVFLDKHMGKGKSTFLLIDECSGIISGNSYMNQRYVKDEILTEENLEKLGIKVKENGFFSRSSKADLGKILNDVSRKIKEKIITTRKRRGDIIGVLDSSTQKIIDEDSKEKFERIGLGLDVLEEKKERVRKITRRVRSKKSIIFGGSLYLNPGDLSNLYRDINWLYNKYEEEGAVLSEAFPAIIRMSLRLFAETAAKDMNLSLDQYIKNNFDKAKSSLDQDAKTMLANMNVKKETIIQLLHTGAHIYSASKVMEQTIAVSIILGCMVTITHGRDDA